MRSRPDWDQYFLCLAFVARVRSHDPDTQHGCILCTPDNHVLSVGYNGFPRGMDDNLLPITRPEKYRWMAHAESNSLANCPVRPTGCTAYVTGESCLPCLMALWQHGVVKVVQAAWHGSHVIDEPAAEPDERERREVFLEQTGMVVVTTRFVSEWLEEAIP